MKKTLIAVVMALTATAASAGGCTAHDAWTGRDKTKHAAVGVLVGAVAAWAFDKPEAALIGLAVAVGKEIKDTTSAVHTCSLQDALVTMAGVGAGVVRLSYTWHF